MAALMSGLYPSTVGLTCKNFHVPKTDCDKLPQSVTTIAETLAAAGYATAGIVANINVDPVFGFAQGFASYFDVSSRRAGDDPKWRFGKSWKNDTTPYVTEHALRWLRNYHRDQPFFLYLHYLDPHDPYEPPERYLTEFPEESYHHGPEVSRRMARYDAEISFVDDGVGQVLAALAAEEHEHDTVVILTSDHGEEFRDHGGFTHGFTLFEEQIRVPLIIRSTEVAAPGSVVAQQVRLIDVFPTVTDLLGVVAPKGLQGVSLLPWIKGQVMAEAPALSEWPYTPLSSLRVPPWKLIANHKTGELSLYDLERDERELHDLSYLHEQRSLQLQEQLKAMKKDAADAGRAFPPDSGSVVLTPEQVKRLEALGYVD